VVNITDELSAVRLPRPPIPSEVALRRVLVICALGIAGSLVSTFAGATALPSTATLPTATGTFGHAPTITFPHGSPPTTLSTVVLRQGTGPVVAKGNLLVANYVGQLWAGKVFDSSYARGETAAFPIGLGMVIPAWDKVLVGEKVGTRLLMVAPPADGYGATGNTGAGIGPNATLVFVVDIVAAYSKSIGTTLTGKVVKTSAGGITVADVSSGVPTIKIAKGTAKPKSLSSTVLSNGSGNKIVPGMAVLQYVLTDWTGKVLQSTWSSGTPDGEVVGNAKNKSAFDALVGLRMGSRVLFDLPASTSSGGPYALVVEVAAEAPSGNSP